MNAQQLKNSILQMAVQGKLVPQDPNDEPASVLLERIRKEKEQLIKEGKIKKEKNPSYIFRGADNTPYEKIGNAEPVSIAEEVPFEIPESWEWVRLADLTVKEVKRGKSPTYIASSSTLVFAQKCNVKTGGIDISLAKFLDEKTLVKYPVEEFMQDHDIVVNSTGTGTMGRIGLFRESDNPKGLPIVPDSHVTVVRLNHDISVEYLVCCLQYYQPYLEEHGEGSTNQKELKPYTIKNLLIPLPPAAEQYRIASLVVDLEKYVVAYGKKESQLTTLNRDFPDQLRKSILQMAVQGKLVPQNSSDEPASVLLERIHAEKERMIKEGKIKRDKHESVIFRRDNSHYEKLGSEERCIDDEIPFDVPDSWTWCRLGHILLKLSDGTHSTPKYQTDGIPFLSVKDISSGVIDFSNCKHISKTEHKDLYSRCNPEYGDLLLTKVGTTGIPVIVDTTKEFSIFVSVALLKFNQKLLYNKFLLYEILSPLVQKQAEENTRGVGNKNWVMRDISKTLIAIPPIEEQYRIVNMIEYLFLQCNNI